MNVLNNITAKPYLLFTIELDKANVGGGLDILVKQGELSQNIKRVSTIGPGRR